MLWSFAERAAAGLGRQPRSERLGSCGPGNGEGLGAQGQVLEQIQTVKQIQEGRTPFRAPDSGGLLGGVMVS